MLSEKSLIESQEFLESVGQNPDFRDQHEYSRRYYADNCYASSAPTDRPFTEAMESAKLHKKIKASIRREKFANISNIIMSLKQNATKRESK